MRRHTQKPQSGFTISAAQQWCHRVALQRHPSDAGTDIRQSGFTIVELMIATVVSSVILIVITFGIVRFTHDYYSGINGSNTQTTAQGAIDAISHAIEFNATGTVATNGSQGIFCAGSQVFLYTMGKQLTAAPSAANWGLYQLNNPSANCVIPGSTTGGTELLGKNMRLTYINLAQQAGTNVWNLEFHIAYGDPDLLCRRSIVGAAKGSCTVGATSYTTTDVIQGNDVVCKSQKGSQFCSISYLTTAVGQRIN
jgi:prepilin-type N-terminal cleavage/methylation domain-containing protein